MLGIIEYGAGNIASVANAFDAIGVKSKIVEDLSAFKNVSHLVLPGVGSFGYGMKRLQDKGFVEAIKEHVNKGNPFVGICLGMQLLFEKSYEEGQHTGLGLIHGEVRSFEERIDLVVPHVGWNDVALRKKSRIISSDDKRCYYFVHSYYCECKVGDDIVGETDYGIKFHSAIEKGNVFGLQFHPEKSQSSGLAILERFMRV